MAYLPPPAAPPPGGSGQPGPHPGQPGSAGPTGGEAAVTPGGEPVAAPDGQAAATPGGIPPAGPSAQGPWYPPAGTGFPPGQSWYPWPAGWYAPGVDPTDPLVSPPGAGLGGWYDRCVGVVRRGWRVLLPILLITHVLPAVVLLVLSLGVDPGAHWEASFAQDPSGLPDGFLRDLAVLFLVSAAGGVLIMFVQCLGWAGGSWVIARQAVGQPVGVGTALRYGLRRAPGLWGWTLLAGVIVGVGLCLCVVPGIYLAFALSLAGPVYLFERRDPIGRAFGMFHRRFGMVLGRLALVVAVVLVGDLLVGAVQSAATAPFGADPLAGPGTAVGVVAALAVTELLSLPVDVLSLVGLVVTYAEQRAHEGPVSSAVLAGELD